MNFTIPTIEDIVSKYSNYELNTEDAIEAKRKELHELKKDDLIEMILESQRTKKGDTVQDLARAILSDEEMIAADYETIAAAIREMRPDAKTSSKSIASYVSKKRDEWALPPRIRITKQRAQKTEEPAE